MGPPAPSIIYQKFGAPACAYTFEIQARAAAPTASCEDVCGYILYFNII